MWQVIGHDRAVRLLQHSIDADRVSHAYLFSGPRQVGKFTLAREFAKALNCPRPDRPCGECRSCQKIERSIHPDVQAVELKEGSKNISIDAVRELQGRIALRPIEGRVKVYTIDEAERLSEPAANSLLKMLEEPPPLVVMVLTTRAATMLLPTMVSRCQQVDLRPVPASAIHAALGPRLGEDLARAKLLAHLARGRVGWAIHAAANPTILDRRKELLTQLSGLPAASRVARLAYAAELASLYDRDQEAAREVLETWQSWWRDLLLTRLGLTDMVMNVDLRDRLMAESRGTSIGNLGRMVAAVQETMALLAQNVNTRLALEVLLLTVPRSA